MTHELIYTSAPKGLKPGSRGFSTVAQTRHTPGVLAESLEALSGYKFAFPMGSSQERLNPVAYSHFILSSGGIAHHVLSRVSAAPPDYTGRSNKLAHHLVLTPAEAAQLPGGPAALMEQPDFFKTSWSGDPHWIEAPRSLKACEATTSVCSQWKKTTGDAGWAGKLAEEWQSNSSSPLILVFPEGLDVLPLVEESLSLLPPADRWRLTFSTYFTSLPAGVRECSLRCILAGSEEHQKSLAQVGSRIVDLSKPLPSLETSSLIDDARNGTRLTKPNPIPQIPKTSKPPAIKPVPTNGPPPPVRVEVVEDATWVPPDPFGTPSRQIARTRRRRRSWAYPLIAAITALLLLSVGVGTFFLIRRQPSTTIAKTDKQSESDVESTPKPDPEPTLKANAPDQPSKDPLESQPQPGPTADGKKGEADIKKTEASRDGNRGEKEAEQKALEEQNKNTPDTETEPEVPPPAQTPQGDSGDEEEPLLIQKIDNKVFFEKQHFEAEHNQDLLSVGYPGDNIYLAGEEHRTSKWSFKVDDKTTLILIGTPLLKTGTKYTLLKKLTIKFEDPGDKKKVKVAANDQEPIALTFQDTPTWDAFIEKWRTSESFPLERKDKLKIEIKTTSNNERIADCEGKVSLDEMEIKNKELAIKLTEVRATNNDDQYTAKLTKIDGKEVDIGELRYSSKAIKWSGSTDMKVKKRPLRSLYLIVPTKDGSFATLPFLDQDDLKFDSISDDARKRLGTSRTAFPGKGDVELLDTLKVQSAVTLAYCSKPYSLRMSDKIKHENEKEYSFKTEVNLNQENLGTGSQSSPNHSAANPVIITIKFLPDKNNKGVFIDDKLILELHSTERIDNDIYKEIEKTLEKISISGTMVFEHKIGERDAKIIVADFKISAKSMPATN